MAEKSFDFELASGGEWRTRNAERGMTERTADYASSVAVV
jgi:hypothetical protein